jgi:hypothetical protein
VLPGNKPLQLEQQKATIQSYWANRATRVCWLCERTVVHSARVHTRRAAFV